MFRPRGAWTASERGPEAFSMVERVRSTVDKDRAPLRRTSAAESLRWEEHRYATRRRRRMGSSPSPRRKRAASLAAPPHRATHPATHARTPCAGRDDPPAPLAGSSRRRATHLPGLLGLPGQLPRENPPGWWSDLRFPKPQVVGSSPAGVASPPWGGRGGWRRGAEAAHVAGPLLRILLRMSPRPPLPLRHCRGRRQRQRHPDHRSRGQRRGRHLRRLWCVGNPFRV